MFCPSMTALVSGTADGVFAASTRFLEVQKLPLKDCIGNR